jgi:16S rRNA (uracil1498-N3)-methyltransferase
MQLFQCNSNISKTLELNETESKHCFKVLRLEKDSIIYLIDGAGSFYKAKIVSPNAKKCKIEIIETHKEFEKRNYKLHIAIAPTKNIERFEWFLEKATEIGIDEITPIFCFHSERKIIKPERLNKIIVSAAKQSIKAYFPKLNEPIGIMDFFKQEFICEKYIAHCQSDSLKSLKELYNSEKSSLILIGPEGDFSNKEIQIAKEKNFREISLGNSRLRTETAGIIACHTVSLLND